MSPPVRPAAVALELLSDEERALAARALEEDPSFRAEVSQLRELALTLDALDLKAWRPEAPPPLDDDNVLAPRPSHRPRRRRLLAPAAAAAAAVAALVPALGARDGRDATTLALRPIGGVAGHATLSISGDDAELRGEGMRPSGPRDYYEAWLADARGRMVSMGTFRVRRDGTVDAHMPVAVDVHRYRLVDVSLEPDDGDPAHSRVSVMRATL